MSNYFDLEPPVLERFFQPLPLEILIERILRKDGGWRKLKPNEFRVSETGNCSIQLYWSRVMPEFHKEISITTAGKFAIGNAFHEYIQKHIGNTIAIEHPVRYTPKEMDISLSGHIDLLTYTNYGLQVVDIKTHKPKGWDYLVNIKKKTSPMYYTQVNTYASIVQTQYWSILYVEKVDFKTWVYTEETNEIHFEETIGKLRDVYHCIQEEKIPKADGEKWECQLCRFAELCKQEKCLPEGVYVV